MLQKHLLLWLTLSSMLAGFWPNLFGATAFDPFLASASHIGWIVAAVMFCVGTLLPTDEVRNVLNRWPLIVGGTAVQYISMPFLAWAVATAFGMTGDLRVGTIMVGCVPGAMASNVLTMVARGNVSYSVGLTTSATLLSPLIVPVALRLTLGAQADAEFLTKSAVSLVIQVVIPVLLGLFSQRLSILKQVADRISSHVANISILWVIAIVVAANRQAIQEFPVVLIAGLLLINFGGYVAGQLGGRLLRLDSGMRRALMLEIGMQNAGVGASLAKGLFPDNPRVALPCGLFAFGCMTTGTLLAQFLRNRTAETEDSLKTTERPTDSALSLSTNESTEPTKEL